MRYLSGEKYFTGLMFFPRSNNRRKATSGFTLLELLIVVAIIATLAAIAMPAYSSYIERVRIEVAIQDINQISKGLLAFKIDNDRFPDTLLEARISMLDPWKHAYQYTLLQGQPLSGPGKVTPRKDRALHPLNSDYDLCSMGPDGDSAIPLTAKASHDDIIRAADGAFVGIAENF
jgi:general secretion pathway protein G